MSWSLPHSSLSLVNVGADLEVVFAFHVELSSLSCHVTESLVDSTALVAIDQACERERQVRHVIQSASWDSQQTKT